ncbi:MAG: hypothetical protein WCK21_02215 [Actinomycetota bacterium]
MRFTGVANNSNSSIDVHRMNAGRADTGTSQIRSNVRAQNIRGRTEQPQITS